MKPSRKILLVFFLIQTFHESTEGDSKHFKEDPPCLFPNFPFWAKMEKISIQLIFVSFYSFLTLILYILRIFFFALVKQLKLKLGNFILSVFRSKIFFLLKIIIFLFALLLPANLNVTNISSNLFYLSNLSFNTISW